MQVYYVIICLKLYPYSFTLFVELIHGVGKVGQEVKRKNKLIFKMNPYQVKKLQVSSQTFPQYILQKKNHQTINEIFYMQKICFGFNGKLVYFLYWSAKLSHRTTVCGEKLKSHTNRFHGGFPANLFHLQHFGEFSPFPLTHPKTTFNPHFSISSRLCPYHHPRGLRENPPWKKIMNYDRN